MKAARFVVLGIAIAAGGLAALLASSGDEKPAPAPVVKAETVDVLIARGEIGIGQTVTEAEFEWQPWPKEAANSIFIRKSDRPDAATQLAGSIARGSFLQGEPIREEKLIKGKGSGYLAAVLPTGKVALSTEVKPETGAGGFILPGDFVDAILARRDREAEKAAGIDNIFTSETILSGVRVLAIDQTVEEKNGQRVVVGKTATLEITPRQAETLALGQQLGVVSLALRSLVDADKKRGGEVDDAKKNSVNMVRFGVSTMVTPK